LGYFLGPVSVILMNSILSNYLNVYYTDVIRLGEVWGGWFLSFFPIVVKLLDALTFILMGMIVDRFRSRQGIARPWILVSAPLLVISMILLFAVPDGSEWLLVVWIFFSYNLFYSVAYTAYNTCHTLLVPLSTADLTQRSKLSVLTNMQPIMSGMVVAVLFPTFVVPAMGINKGSWVTVMTCIAAAAFPCILLEYYFTRERITEAGMRKKTAPEKRSLKEQLRLCMKSKVWVALMVYLILNHTVGLLANYSTFYYCNWVLGSYNDGRTQALYYTIGNAPLGLGMIFCRPICKKLGRRNAMAGGFLLAAMGALICFLNPRNLTVVLIGQAIKSLGLIPSTFMVTAMLADALDDVEAQTGIRCDGFSSSVYNVIFTVTTGLAMCILNLGVTQLGYQAPGLDGSIPVQTELVQNFFTFGAVGAQAFIFPIIAMVLLRAPDDRKKGIS
jgi:GPH family glycoside/pentoside/hexuronide:cation symporter